MNSWKVEKPSASFVCAENDTIATKIKYEFMRAVPVRTLDSNKRIEKVEAWVYPRATLEQWPRVYPKVTRERRVVLGTNLSVKQLTMYICIYVLISSKAVAAAASICSPVGEKQHGQDLRWGCWTVSAGWGVQRVSVRVEVQVWIRAAKRQFNRTP